MTTPPKALPILRNHDPNNPVGKLEAREDGRIVAEFYGPGLPLEAVALSGGGWRVLEIENRAGRYCLKAELAGLSIPSPLDRNPHWHLGFHSGAHRDHVVGRWWFSLECHPEGKGKALYEFESGADYSSQEDAEQAAANAATVALEFLARVICEGEPP